MKKLVNIKFQYIFPFLLFYLITIYSCKDDSVSNNNDNYNLITSISDIVYDLPDTSRLVKAMVHLDFINYTVDSSIADSNNSIILNLSPPQSQYLLSVVGYFTNDTASVIISDRNAKVNRLTLYAFYDYSGNFAGEIVKDNHITYSSDSAGYFVVSPLYCDRKLRISGSSVFMYNNNQDTSKSIFDINMDKGWNVLTLRINVSRNGYREVEIFEGEPIGAKFYFIEANLFLYNQLNKGHK